MKYLILRNSKDSPHFNAIAPWAVYDDGQLVAMFKSLKCAKDAIDGWMRYLG